MRQRQSWWEHTNALKANVSFVAEMKFLFVRGFRWATGEDPVDCPGSSPGSAIRFGLSTDDLTPRLLWQVRFLF